jgi:type IV secretory pathway VirB10-like protein
MAFNLSNRFKRKNEMPDEEERRQRMDEDQIGVDSKNPFEGDISFDEKDTREGPRLNRKYVMLVAAAVVMIGVGSVLSNVLFPDAPPSEQAQRPLSTNAKNEEASLAKIPSNYADLAKYEDDKARKRAEEELQRKKEEDAQREAKQRAEEQRLRAEQRAQNVQRPSADVSLPRVNTSPRTDNNGGISRSEQKAYSSNVGFNIGSGGSNGGGGITSYVLGSSGNVDMGEAHVIHAGTVIPATLLSGVTSDGSNNDVIAQVRQDVYDSLTGRHLLIPQGSRLVGVRSGVSNRRMEIAFLRLILPDGTSVELPKQQAVDKSGYGGVKDRYDTHSKTFFRSAIISGVMSYLADEVDSHAGRDSYTNEESGNSYKTALNDTVGKITDKIMERSDRDADRNPTVTIRPGFQFNVFINQDLTAYEYIR